MLIRTCNKHRIEMFNPLYIVGSITKVDYAEIAEGELNSISILPLFYLVDNITGDLRHLRSFR